MQALACETKLCKSRYPFTKGKVAEEFLLSAMALKLKRMIRAILLTSRTLKIRAKAYTFRSDFFWVNRSLILPY